MGLCKCQESPTREESSLRISQKIPYGGVYVPSGNATGTGGYGGGNGTGSYTGTGAPVATQTANAGSAVAMPFGWIVSALLVVAICVAM